MSNEARDSRGGGIPKSHLGGSINKGIDISGEVHNSDILVTSITVQDQCGYVWHDGGISRVIAYVSSSEHGHCVRGPKRPTYDADATFGAIRARFTNECVLDEVVHKSNQCASDVLKEDRWIFDKGGYFCICILGGS